MKLEDLPLQGKRVLVRVDFNVPLDKQGNITDDTRIRAALPTIQYLLDQNASVILMSHLGRPKGKKEPKYSLAPCAKRLEELLQTNVELISDFRKKHKAKGILLLENLRFDPAEEDPDADPTFAEDLAKLGDFYVNDAFGTAHRKHSSTYTLAGFFQGRAAPGLLMQKEIDFLGSHFASPTRPFYAIIGGAKVSSKLGVLRSLLGKVDALFIGGGMAYTFFLAMGKEIGDSLVEADLTEEAKKILLEAKENKIPLFFPKDLVVADRFSDDANKKIVFADRGIEKGWQGMDIGPITRTEWANTLKNARMIFWNGPLGVFELQSFCEGTHCMAETLSGLDAITIIGGGDSVHAINQLKLADQFSHISTGGGACLEYIEMGSLPCIEALK